MNRCHQKLKLRTAPLVLGEGNAGRVQLRAVRPDSTVTKEDMHAATVVVQIDEQTGALQWREPRTSSYITSFYAPSPVLPRSNMQTD
jgi:hypothetical protein